MQRIDYWVGIPLCIACSFVQRVASLCKRRRVAANPPRKVLYIELSEMGSAILAHPTLRRTAEVFPGAETHFLIFRRNAESVEILELLKPESIHVIDDRNLVRFVFSSLRTLVKLRRLRFDTLIDLELFSRCTALMSFFIAAPVRVGFHKYTEEGLYRGSFLTHRVAYNPHFHISRNFAALLEAASQSPTEEPLLKAPIPAGSELPRLNVEAERGRAQQSLRALCPFFGSHHRIVLLNPDPGLLALRGWPVESYRLLTQRLLDLDPSIIVGIIGLKRSAHFHSAIAAGASEPSRIINLCGVTSSMRELLGVFSLSSVLVSNDSGPGHFAPLVGLPSVILFGPESPHRYAPLGPECTTLFANYACSPCFSAQNHRQSVCTNNRCLQAISVEDVFTATVRALGSQRVMN